MTSSDYKSSPIPQQEKDSKVKKEPTIFRSKHDKENPYVMISKKMIRGSLSLSAKGLLSYLLCLPNDWKTHPKLIAKEVGIGKDKIYGLLNELIEKGYCVRHEHKENGVFSETTYEYYEDCILNKCLPRPGFPDAGNPDPENPDTTKERSSTEERKTTTEVVVKACAKTEEIKAGLIKRKLNISDETLNEYIDTYGIEHVYKKIWWCTHESEIFKKEKITDKAGFILAAIKNDYK